MSEALLNAVIHVMNSFLPCMPQPCLQINFGNDDVQRSQVESYPLHLLSCTARLPIFGVSGDDDNEKALQSDDNGTIHSLSD